MDAVDADDFVTGEQASMIGGAVVFNVVNRDTGGRGANEVSRERLKPISTG
jgi:hypothetical protein